MKSVKPFICGILIVLCLYNTSCEDFLEPKVYSETAPDNLFNSLQGIESILFGAYAKAAEMPGSNVAAHNMLGEENLGDIVHSDNAGVRNFRNYVISPAELSGGGAHTELLWNMPYEAIRNANIIFDNIDDASINDASKQLIRAEAIFLRAISYYRLYMRFGEVPLRTSTLQEMELPRADEQALIDFMESELLAAIPGLPEPGEEPARGRAHKAAAIGYLMKLCLNTKQWQKAADAAQQIIDMGIYGLFPDYFGLFFVANEGNEEMIWVRTAKSDLNRTATNTIMNIAYPPAFKSHPATGFVISPEAQNFSGGVFVYDWFFNSFDPDDKRKTLIIEDYINASGNAVDLTTLPDNRAVFKYWPDDDVVGPSHGNDIPVIRYADVLLTRAEALNELNGPNIESIDLINLVRDRAGVSDVALADFASTEELRDHILMERGWEFYCEEQRRHDLIRHGKLIERAVERGALAESHHVRFPIPLFAMDANPNLQQNPGY